MTAVQPTETPTPEQPPRSQATVARNQARKHRSTAPAHPSRRGLVQVFRAVLVLCIVALVAHAYVVGHGTNVGLGGFVESLLKATSSTGTAIVVAFAILIVAGVVLPAHAARAPGHGTRPDRGAGLHDGMTD